MANIIIPKVELDISGNIILNIRDVNGNTKQHEEFKNTIWTHLKDNISLAMRSDSAVNHFINTSSGWFNSTYPKGVGEDGIMITQTTHTNTDNGVTWVDSETSSDPLWDLYLDENLSTTYDATNSPNQASWTAEGTWEGKEGSGTATSNSFDKMQIGKDWKVTTQEDINAGTHRLLEHFDYVFASATAHGNDFTAFSLDDNDVARVTWTITIS
jgi:hypothetical protein